MISLKRILVPTDFSEFSKAATGYACEFAARFDAELHVLHIFETNIYPAPESGFVFDLSNIIRESRAAAEKALIAVVDPKWAEGRTVVHAIIEGSPFVEIVRYSREKDIDLIVLATHGRTGLDHVLFGSVAEKVVRKAPCPVLTVRPEGHQFVMP